MGQIQMSQQKSTVSAKTPLFQRDIAGGRQLHRSLRQVFEFSAQPMGMQLDPIRDARIFERLESLDGRVQVNHELDQAAIGRLLPSGRAIA